MNLQPRIEQLAPIKLVGKKLLMSVANDRTPELWQSFMPHRNKIANTVSGDLYNVRIYDKVFDIDTYTMETPFEKWAAREVTDFRDIPEGMETHILAGGMYAVFLYKGAAAQFQDTFMYIFNTWIPGSEYEVDHREHFDLLGSKYMNNHPDSEEEIWVPVKRLNG